MALFSRRHERDTTDGGAPETDRVPSGQTGPVSRPVPVVTGPTPIVELHDSLLHTATPRYIGTVGLAATMISGIAATLSSFTEDGLQNMRPQIDAALVISVAVMAFGCLWWSTFATTNGRRVTRGRTLGPILPMAVYVAIAVGYLAVNATVHGEARVWGWIAWLLVAFAAHSYVMVAFKSSAQTIGNPTTHFTQVAMIPVMMAGAVAVGMGVGVLRGIPFLAVPLLMAWMVPELFRAMAGWDRACEQRMRVMLRDFTYDTPSGATPVTTNPSTTGRTAAVAPLSTEVAPMVNPDAPARVPGTHHPIRPTWNPVEEARRKAEAQAAAAMGGVPGGAGGPSALDAYMEGVAPPRTVQAPRRHHHTLIPKLLVTFGAIFPFLGGLAAWMLVRNGHFEIGFETFRYDTTGRRALVLTMGVFAVCNVAAWVWWATASLANVRLRSATAPWPGRVPAAYWTIIAGGALVVIGNRMDLTVATVLGWLMVIVASCYAYFGVLAALRQAAGTVGAPREPWTTLMMMPLYLVILGSINRAVQQATGSREALYVISAINLALNLWQAFAFVRAVWSFDEASRRPPAPKLDEAHVPLYLRHAMGAR